MAFPFPDLSEIQFKAVRSRGPGGQNVNKVNSCAQLTWDFSLSFSLNEKQKQTIQEKLSAYINKKGILKIHSDEYRDLERNKARCLEKLEKILKKAFFVQKRRKKTKPTKTSQRKRVEQKKQRSQVKKDRKKVAY